jgi:hypothetical protein
MSTQGEEVEGQRSERKLILKMDYLNKEKRLRTFHCGIAEYYDLRIFVQL